MLRRRRSADSYVDAATVAALRTTINTITTVAKVGATLIARATESDEAVAWRAPAMREVEMEEVAIATVQALGEFYKRNRRAINLIVRAYMLYIFLSMVLQLALALLQFAFTCLFTLFIFIVLYKLPLAANMDLIFA